MSYKTLPTYQTWTLVYKYTKMKNQNMLPIKTIFLLVEQTKPYYETIHSSIYETSINTDVKIT